MIEILLRRCTFPGQIGVPWRGHDEVSGSGARKSSRFDCFRAQESLQHEKSCSRRNHIGQRSSACHAWDRTRSDPHDRIASLSSALHTFCKRPSLVFFREWPLCSPRLRPYIGRYWSAKLFLQQLGEIINSDLEINTY